MTRPPDAPGDGFILVSGLAPDHRREGQDDGPAL